jgi:hypothetical protein
MCRDLRILKVGPEERPFGSGYTTSIRRYAIALRRTRDHAVTATAFAKRFHRNPPRAMISEEPEWASSAPLPIRRAVRSLGWSHLFNGVQKGVSVGSRACGPRDMSCERIDVSFAQCKHPIVHGNLKEPDAHEHAGR